MMMSNSETIYPSRIHLHPGQSRIWKNNSRFLGMIAGTGGGKSWFGPIWLYREISKNPSGGFLVISPTYTMFQRIVLPITKEFLDRFTRGDYKAGERTYYLPTGGKVYFGSGDNPLSLEGVHVQAAWLDEAGQMKREVWDVVQRRVGFYKGRILLTTTPYNFGWLKTEIYDRWKEGDSNYFIHQFASTQNPYYPKEEFERAKNTLPEWKFKMFYLGQFVRPEGLVYKDFDPSKHIIEPFQIPKSWKRVVGVDFGFNNPTAAIWFAVSPDGVVFAYREYYRRNRLIGEVVSDFKFLTLNEPCDVVVCDPSEPAYIEEFRRAGFNAFSANNSVMEGIETVISYFKSNRLFLFRGLPNTLDEIENYRWIEKSDRIQDSPVKEYDHAMDALRYGIMEIASMKALNINPLSVGKTSKWRS